jgi:F-type H+-transporting ATPase subunit k
MGTLGLLFGGSYAAMSGPSKAKAVQTPPINASSSDEENFIKCENMTSV